MEGITQLGLFWTEKSGRIKEAQRGLKRVGWIVPMLLLFVCFCLLLATLGLCGYRQAFSNCSEQGPLPSCDAQASRCSGVSCHRARALSVQAQ